MVINIITMKKSKTSIISKIVVTLIIIHIATNMHGQEWSNPISVTDSASNNRNATIKRLNFFDDDIFIFWEKSTDTTSTSIVYRSFYNEDESHVFISSPGIHFTKPQIIDVSNDKNDTLFYVFYESDQTGVNSIYYRIFAFNEFTDPQRLTNSYFAQTMLQCGNGRRIVWVENGKIMHSKITDNNTLETPVVIDSGDVSFPSVSQIEMDWFWGWDYNTIAYIKNNNGSSSIITRTYDNNQGWLAPLVIHTGDECTNLSFCTGFGDSMIISWDLFDGSDWNIYTYNLYAQELTVSEFNLQYPAYPKVYSVIIFVKGKDGGAGISSFINIDNNISDVLTSEILEGISPPFSYYNNISSSTSDVANTQLYSGKVIGCNQYFINIWEERNNNNWQLKYATSYSCLSNIDEYNIIDIRSFIVSPNPTKGITNISFTLSQKSDIKICIFDSKGMLVETIADTKLNNGNYDYIWDGSSHKAGLYYISVQGNWGNLSEKVFLIE